MAGNLGVAFIRRFTAPCAPVGAGRGYMDNVVLSR
jgi:hypothetical protein